MKKIAALVLALSVCTACTSKTDTAFNGCVEKQSAKLIAQAERGAPGLLESVTKSAPDLAAAACGPIKTLCADDYDGAMCQSTINALK